MTTFENKETSLLLEKDIKLKYSDLLVSIFSQPLKEGITLKQMKIGISILTKLDDAKTGDLIEFTDEELTKIKQTTETHTWGAYNAEIATFGDYIDSL